MSAPTAPDFDPVLLSVLSARIETIIREMINTVSKASRSAVIKNARDLSCGVLTADHRQLCVEEGIPIHISALDLTTRAITDLFDDVKEGDAFLNNCSYTGGTHHADLTVVIPVFYEGELLFWALARSHHADMGAPLPTTYLPEAATIYEEGLNFPCIRIQEDFTDKKDWIRYAMYNIRVSNIWYGDYRAQVGACRVGERRLKDLVAKYGIETIRRFFDEWTAYGERRMIQELKRLPAGEWSYETRHDPIPGVADQGVPVRVTVITDPENGLITIDARDNEDNIPGGFNLSEACALGSCRIGVYFNLDPTLPHNAGSDSRIRVLLRDGAVVGRPKFPAGTSIATTNVNERLINAVQACFAQMGRPFGLGEGAVQQQAGESVISGIDADNGNQPYVNQLFVTYGGGPAKHGTDGWLTYLGSVNAGVIVLDSVEIDEGMYPILIEERKVAPGTMGAGEWNGAPGMTGTMIPLGDELTAIYCSDGCVNPPKGVLGGGAGAAARNMKRLASGEIIDLPGFNSETLRRGEALVWINNGGGGYGDPWQRAPDRVTQDINRGWLSPEAAETVYGVAVRPGELPGLVVTDLARTGQLRATPLAAGGK
ncbi:hydantoinase B/oxoprolinase family protein [Gemmobacter sp. 24YEA27]|uniref:hydantoinase B/oxoprolinase family protein n=1 Tax=Gemmobacter sp. 24YEA27 TaxID=3040672 RepID=UPI0024B38200|nr:hydantoinase B/oxoprolinase family protein [Gemmobacter sp. 24YEA27]